MPVESVAAESTGVSKPPMRLQILEVASYEHSRMRVTSTICIFSYGWRIPKVIFPERFVNRRRIVPMVFPAHDARTHADLCARPQFGEQCSR